MTCSRGWSAIGAGTITPNPQAVIPDGMRFEGFGVFSGVALLELQYSNEAYGFWSWGLSRPVFITSGSDWESSM